MSAIDLKTVFRRNLACGGILLSALAMLSGCGESRPANARVTGKVVVAGGIPLTEGKLILVPENPSSGQSPPGATIKSDGTFDAYSSSGGAGIPPGKYKVLLSFSSGMGSTNPLIQSFRKYAKAETTPLTLDVPAGGLKDVTLEVEDAGVEEEAAASKTTPAGETPAGPGAGGQP